jgi:site-specific recombinase XerD
VRIFLNKQGFKDVLHPSDVPTYTEKIVKAYQPEPMTVLFAAADWEDLMLFHFFLGGGARDNEVVHAGFHDIDFKLKTYDVREQPDFPKFQVKDFEERVVPLTDALIEMLCEHRKRHPTARLLFPRSDGKPDHHLILRLKAVALKAGLNCGRCVKKNKKTREIKTCVQFPVCKEWTLHRFRKTFATMHSEAGERLETISTWLGHADLETTKTYLEVGTHRPRKLAGRSIRHFSGSKEKALNGPQQPARRRPTRRLTLVGRSLASGQPLTKDLLRRRRSGRRGVDDHTRHEGGDVIQYAFYALEINNHGVVVLVGLDADHDGDDAAEHHVPACFIVPTTIGSTPDGALRPSNTTSSCTGINIIAATSGGSIAMALTKMSAPLALRPTYEVSVQGPT